MKPIQLLLIVIMSVLTVVYILFYKSKTLNRIIFIVTFLTGMLFVLVPNLTNSIAHFFGVGRGADLLLYSMVILFYAAFIYLYSKIRRIEIVQTEIIRGNAIRNATKLL